MGLDKLVGSKTWSVGAVCNGILGGFVYFGASNTVLKVCKVDDPLDAFAVHGACGFWGVLAGGLFADAKYGYGACSGGGLFAGNGDCIGVAVASLFAEIAWVGTMSLILFGSLKAAKVLRVSEEVEDAGMDISKHGGTAYESGVLGK